MTGVSTFSRGTRADRTAHGQTLGRHAPGTSAHGLAMKDCACRHPQTERPA